MITMWIIIGVAAIVSTVIWRLRKASTKLDQILREELAEPVLPEPSEAETLPASHDR